MEAIIKTDDQEIFKALVQFLRSLNIDVNTNDKKSTQPVNKVINSSGDNWDELLEFISKHRKKLPDGFKFNREEAHER